MDASVSAKANLSSTFEADVREIVTAKYVRPAGVADSVAGVRPSLVVEPGTEQELAKVLKLANAAGLAVVPRGGGTKLEWGNAPARADVILSTARLNRVLEHAWADLTVSVEAGCTIENLQETLAKHGQRLALDALWAERATVGGVLSANDSGALRLRFGSLRDLVIGVTVALADGTVASSGGRVVKNVAGYDLPKLITGAMGTLGVITRAFFRLHPVPRSARTVSCITGSVREAQELMLGIQNSKLAHSGLQICCDGEMQARVDTLFEGTDEGCTAQTVQMKFMMSEATLGDARAEVWNAREEICSVGAADDREGDFAAAKICLLPAEIGDGIEMIREAAGPGMRWRVAFEATGIGWLRLEGVSAAIGGGLLRMREWVDGRGGSLVILRRAAGMRDADAWGGAGDGLELMRAVKRQFDPAGTLNRGRFVGGI